MEVRRLYNMERFTLRILERTNPRARVESIYKLVKPSRSCTPGPGRRCEYFRQTTSAFARFRSTLSLPLTHSLSLSLSLPSPPSPSLSFPPFLSLSHAGSQVDLFSFKRNENSHPPRNRCDTNDAIYNQSCHFIKRN